MSVPVELCDWGKQHARSFDDDQALLEIVREARIVAVGEPGHGAHEPLAFRNRLIRLMVQHNLLSGIALETGILESRRVNAFVRGDEGEAELVAREHLNWGFGAQAENVALISWLREYNRSAQRRVSLHGFDIPGGDARGEISGAAIATRSVASLLAACEGLRTSSILTELERVGAHLNRAAVRALSPDKRASMRRSINRIEAYVSDHARALISAKSSEEHEWGARAVRMIRALFEMFCLWPDVPPGVSRLPEDAIPAMLAASGVRDAAMAENVAWLLQRQGPEARILLFAADGHLIGDQHRGGLWTGHTDLGLPCGYHLRAKFGQNMRVLLCISDAAVQGSTSWAEAPGSLDMWLASLRRDRLLLELGHAPPDPWLDAPQSIRPSGGPIQAFIPRRACDVLVYFPQLTPAARVGHPS